MVQNLFNPQMVFIIGEGRKEIELDFDIFWHFIGYLASANRKQKNSSSRTLSHQDLVDQILNWI